MYEPRMVYSAEDVNVCGSIYQDINIYEYVKDNIGNIRSGIVLTCPPCQVAVIKQLLKRHQIPAFIISFCCSGQTTIEGTWRYYEFIGIKKENVINMQYRGNGWPSGIQIWLKDGTQVYHENFTEPWSTIHKSGLFRPKRCYYCKLDTNYKADVSIADPWLEEYKLNDKIGHTLFVVNSEQGMNTISKMQKEDIISFIKTDYNTFYKAQKNNIEKEIRVESQQIYLKWITRLVACHYYTYFFSRSLCLMQLHLWIRRGISYYVRKIKKDNNRVKQYINISGFNIHASNRGNAALTYGAVAFLENKGLLKEGMEIVRYHSFNNPFRFKNLLTQTERVTINGKQYVHKEIPLFSLEKKLIMKFGIILPFTPFGRTVKKIAFEAANYGGDGFSDIYGDETFLSRMHQTFVLWKVHVPLIMLPQTIGPFKKKQNYDLAVKIMRYAKEVYVRDDKFISEFEKLGIKYTLTKDISYYMKPEPWDIEIKENAVGLNVSGLAYGNRFKGLEGLFDSYPKLVAKIISNFRKKGCSIYLIPHSYTYNKPDDNDDMVACRNAYENLKDKSNVVLIDKDMTAPQVKYIISRMTFFIGARMHANFAAIYTGVPVFGTAYSYKFEGAFNANGLDGKEQTEMINNLKLEDVESYVKKIDAVYNRCCQQK